MRTPLASLPARQVRADGLVPEALAQGYVTKSSDNCLRIGPDGPVIRWPTDLMAFQDDAGVVYAMASDGTPVVATGQWATLSGGWAEDSPAGCDPIAGSFDAFQITITEPGGNRN